MANVWKMLMNDITSDRLYESGQKKIKEILVILNLNHYLEWRSRIFIEYYCFIGISCPRSHVNCNYLFHFHFEATNISKSITIPIKIDEALSLLSLILFLKCILMLRKFGNWRMLKTFLENEFRFTIFWFSVWKIPLGRYSNTLDREVVLEFCTLGHFILPLAILHERQTYWENYDLFNAF